MRKKKKKKKPIFSFPFFFFCSIFQVGTANMGCGIINASRSKVPILVCAGRSPWFDGGIPGSRSNFVQWGQDSFDQEGYFREYTKWDYELKHPHHFDIVVSDCPREGGREGGREKKKATTTTSSSKSSSSSAAAPKRF